MVLHQILNVNVDAITKRGLLQRIVEGQRNGRPEVFSYVNINALNLARKNLRFRAFLNNADVTYCDGEGVRLGARILGHPFPARISLTHFIWEIFEAAQACGVSVFFLGSTYDTVRKAAQRALDRFPRLKIAGFHDGYFCKSGEESERVVDFINITRPDILFVGFGMPLQEEWIEDHLQEINVRLILPCGSMIEYVAGAKTVAPGWMAGNGLEWVFRLFQEPGRLWKRYLVGNPFFLWCVLCERARRFPA